MYSLYDDPDKIKLHYFANAFLCFLVFFFVSLPATDDTGNGDIDTGRVCGRLGQQVDVGTAQLLREGQTGHTAVVLHLEVLMRKSC